MASSISLVSLVNHSWADTWQPTLHIIETENRKYVNSSQQTVCVRGYRTRAALLTSAEKIAGKRQILTSTFFFVEACKLFQEEWESKSGLYTARDHTARTTHEQTHLTRWAVTGEQSQVSSHRWAEPRNKVRNSIFLSCASPMAVFIARHGIMRCLLWKSRSILQSCAR